MALNFYYWCGGFALVLAQVIALVVALKSFARAKANTVAIVATAEIAAAAVVKIDDIGAQTGVLTKILVDNALLEDHSG